MFLCRRYFGFPRAEEDGEVRACSLALALVADAAQMRQERGAAALTVSVGIHAAVVVVGRLDGGGRPVAQGEAPSLARQLRAAAGPSCDSLSARPVLSLEVPSRNQAHDKPRFQNLAPRGTPYRTRGGSKEPCAFPRSRLRFPLKSGAKVSAVSSGLVGRASVVRLKHRAAALRLPGGTWEKPRAPASGASRKSKTRATCCTGSAAVRGYTAKRLSHCVRGRMPLGGEREGARACARLP